MNPGRESEESQEAGHIKSTIEGVHGVVGLLAVDDGHTDN